MICLDNLFPVVCLLGILVPILINIMSGLLLQVLGLLSTGLMYPSYQGVMPVIEALNEQQQIEQQILQDERERSYQAEQQEIIINDYFLFLDKIGKIKYARGCMGKYSPSSWSEEKQKYVSCSSTAYDCAGLIKGYAVAKGILSKQEASKYNSQSLMSLATKKDVRTLQKGDRTSWKGFGERSTGNLSTHFAIVARDYDDSGTLWIYDNVNGSNLNELGERPIKVFYSRGIFYYLGKYRITGYSNGLVNVAQERGIEVLPWEDITKEVVATGQLMSTIDPNNPQGLSVVIKGFNYDSDMNKIANYRATNSGSDYMIAKFIAEAHGDIYKRGKSGEYGICQLMPNETNNVWIKDPRWNTWQFQAQVCLEKRNAVPNPDKVRFANAYTEIKNILHIK